MEPTPGVGAMRRWQELVEFEVILVMTSAEAAATVALNS